MEKNIKVEFQVFHLTLTLNITNSRSPLFLFKIVEVQPMQLNHYDGVLRNYRNTFIILSNAVLFLSLSR